jgi:hypothetical protein
MQKVLPILNLNIDQRYFWTDSSIVLSWIAAPPNTWNIFVANRVSEIQSLSGLNEWRHISTKYNPADIVSRGMSSNQLKTNDLWWHGPEWLRLPENKWPKSSVNFDSENIPEKRKSTNKILFANVKGDEFLTNFSKFIKLQRVVAFIKRVAHNCRNKNSKLTGPLTASELNDAQIAIIKLIQRDSFKPELKALSENKYVKRQSCLYLLNPILDEDGLIRVGGRIKHSSVTYDKKYPLILPAKHHVTRLLIIQEQALKPH